MPMKIACRKELIEARNNADNTVYSAEKLLKDLGEKIPAELKTEVEDKAARVREVMNNENAEPIRTAVEDLNQVLQKVGAAAYQQPEPEAQAPGDDDAGAGPQPGSDGDDVVDGEFQSA